MRTLDYYKPYIIVVPSTSMVSDINLWFEQINNPPHTWFITTNLLNALF